MQPSQQIAYSSLRAAYNKAIRGLQPRELTYEAVTVAAILLVLGSLWVF
jgi:hypothetical protein